MKILVIGGSGFIGSHVLSAATRNDPTGTFLSNSTVQVEGRGLIRLDVRDSRQVEDVFLEVRPELVIQACCTKSIEFCAHSPHAAWIEHVEGTENVVRMCRDRQVRLAYVSTDCVFDGRKPLYTEDDPTNPFNVYGRVKLEAESVILDARISAVVIRTSFLFGWHQPGQASNFALLALGALRAQHPFHAARNLINTPLEITSAAQAIVQLAVSSHQGVFNVAGSERISRHDFAVAVADAFELDRSLVIPIEDSSGLRQANSCLDVSKTQETLGTRFECPGQGLARMRRVAQL